MAVYTWKGKNKYGDIVGGERIAASVDEVTRSLQKEQIAIISIAAKRGFPSLPFLKREKVRLKELAVYSRQLSVLIDAELPLIQSLGILAEQQKNKYFKRVINTIKEDVEAGSTLHQAKRKHPKVFDDLYCNLVASGEQSGSLDIMLRRLSEYIEKTVKLAGPGPPGHDLSRGHRHLRHRRLHLPALEGHPRIRLDLHRARGGTAVPDGLHRQDEQLRRRNTSSSSSSGSSRPSSPSGITARPPPGDWTTDRAILKLPLFGKLLSKVAISRLTRTLSTLISGGVPMLESLKITSSTTGNVLIEKQILEARQMVAEGKTLHEAFQEAGNFPLMLIQMVNVGEATGTLDEMLSKLANFYDDEVEASVAALLSVMEPILLIGVGGIVGALIISMYLPIFSLIQKF